jgi:rsbT co-antagonist protein RsbR
MTNPARSANEALSSRESKDRSMRLARLIDEHRNDMLSEWFTSQSAIARGSVNKADLQRNGADFLSLLHDALAAGAENLDSRGTAPLREFLEELSRNRAMQGYSPSETAAFVFAFKGPMFLRLREHATDAASLADDVWATTELMDSIGLYTTEVFQQGREELIMRQQQDMLELSTPVVTLWDGVLALPMIGTLDSARTQVVMETLLQRIVQTGADVAIIDITGVPTVDTLTAQHLLKTVTAARLMGADCIISGIRPQIAQTIVHLGVDLGNVTTKASLADAFRLALQRTGRTVARISAVGAANGGANEFAESGTPYVGSSTTNAPRR